MLREDLIYIARAHRDELEHARRLEDYHTRCRITVAEVILFALTLIATFVICAALVMLGNGAELAEAGILLAPALFWYGVVLAIREANESE